MGKLIGAGSLNANGQATVSIASLTIGAHHAITAVYSGDANFTGSASSAYEQTVNQANTTTSVAYTSDPSFVGQTITLTAIVTVPGPGTPTGVITLTIDGTVANVSALSGDAAAFSTSTLIAGTHFITATYSGDANFIGSLGTLPGGQVVVKRHDVFMPIILRQ